MGKILLFLLVFVVLFIAALAWYSREGYSVYKDFADKAGHPGLAGTVAADKRYGPAVLEHVLTQADAPQSAMNCLWDGRNIWDVDTIVVEGYHFIRLKDDPYAGLQLIRDPGNTLRQTVMNIIGDMLADAGITQVHPVNIVASPDYKEGGSRDKDRDRVLRVGYIATRPRADIVMMQFFMPNDYYSYYHYREAWSGTDTALQIKAPVWLQLDKPALRTAEGLYNALKPALQTNGSTGLRFEDCTTLLIRGYVRARVYYNSYWNYLAENNALIRTLMHPLPQGYFARLGDAALGKIAAFRHSLLSLIGKDDAPAGITDLDKPGSRNPQK